MAWKSAQTCGRGEQLPCDACHGNAAIFLTEENVAADEREANRDVIVYQVP